MSEQIYRKKSLERVTSPENLKEYIRVSNPGIWLLILSMIILLIGACVWGIFGHVDSKIQTDAYVSAGKVICYLETENAARVELGMTVIVDGKEGTIGVIGPKEAQGFACVVKMDETPKDGVYTAEIVTERIKPISWILD